VKQTIDKILSRLRLITEVLESTTVKDSADLSLAALVKFVDQQGFDTALGVRLISLLQLSNDDKVFSHYELEDIEKLFDALVAAQPENIGFHIEAVHFYDTVMEKPEKATHHLRQARDVVRKKQAELSQLRQSMEGDGQGNWRNQKYPDIVFTEEILWGQPRVEGRRLAVGDVVCHVDGNRSAILAAEDYEISLSQTRQALKYCSSLQCVKDQVLLYCHNCVLRVHQDGEASGEEQENWVRAKRLLEEFLMEPDK